MRIVVEWFRIKPDSSDGFGWFRTEILSYLSYSVLKCLIFRFERLIIRVHAL